MYTDTVRYKSKKFAVRIINMYKYLCEEKREYVLSKQVLRSGTSIGANVSEAECGFSKNDFAYKLYTALKECNETKYWLELLYETGYLEKDAFESIYSECEEIRKMLSSSTKTLKEQLNK
ncbi:MAG: four helix bundle protein [Oscillospiraceae bacterium]|nr:four helix bundle protein [Oscillospiraceae bacterium]